MQSDSGELLKLDARKQAYLDALRKTFGNISQSCRAVGISRQTHYLWLQNDEQFRIAYENENYNELLMDLVESKLVEEALNNNTAVLIFMAKTKLKSRGYVEKQEIDLKATQIVWKEETYNETDEETK
jgi:hypothetical protein